MTMFLAVIPDSAVLSAVAAVWLATIGAITALYKDGKEAARYAREERKELAAQLDRNTDAIRELGRNCPAGRS